MNLENIVVIGVCLTAIAIVAFYLYRKYSSQKQDIIELSKRCETIEMILSAPPPRNELTDVYNRTQNQNKKFNDWDILGSQEKTNDKVLITTSIIQSHNQQTTQNPESIILQNCDFLGLCDLQPLRIETNEAEINKIVEAEINEIAEDEINKALELKKKSPTKNMKI
jgi:hypothetical protein